MTTTVETLVDSAPLQADVAAELLSRLENADAVALRDPENHIFGVLLSPRQFDLFQALADLAADGRLSLNESEQDTSRQIDLDEFVKRLES